MINAQQKTAFMIFFFCFLFGQFFFDFYALDFFSDGNTDMGVILFNFIRSGVLCFLGLKLFKNLYLSKRLNQGLKGVVIYVTCFMCLYITLIGILNLPGDEYIYLWELVGIFLYYLAVFFMIVSGLIFIFRPKN